MPTSNKEFLLEIGAEEIPARMIPGAVEELQRLLEESLRQQGLSGQAAPVKSVWGTPRRWWAWCPALPDRQQTREELIEGPPKRVALDAAGKHTTAALKFAEKMGVPPNRLRIISTPKGSIWLAAGCSAAVAPPKC